MMSEEYAVLTAAERGRHDADGVEASSIEAVEVVTNDANYESEGGTMPMGSRQGRRIFLAARASRLIRENPAAIK